jgi:radical SAM protein (TIGR01212 family)
MSNCFKNSNTNKRYFTQSYYLKQRFGRKVIKISLNGNFTCPNIDGSKGVGGCTYCSSGSGDFAGNPQKSITEQFNDVKAMLNEKWSDGVYIPYFQANTNTYAPLEKLKLLYKEALSIDGTVGLAVSTRPDCISDETADYLAELSQKTYLTVELGLQTVHDTTAEKINRCHTYADFLSGYEKLNQRGINICVHIINGLPGETHDMMLETAQRLSNLNLHSIKIHLLHIIKNTVMAKQYQNGEFSVLELDEYVNIVCDQLEILPPDLIIQRITGDGNKDTLIAPLWSLKKFVVMNEIDKELVRRNSWQGKYYGKK